DLSVRTARLARGYEAICGFVRSDVSAGVVNALSEVGVNLILMRCAGFNNVYLDATEKCCMTVLRVPGYSPEAVAE
ncbi:2-hydroxyacid dehydrogenase, partial [Coprococcus eutactus]|nr:2-hydroxyacid dehydrogenase [Coprococcus eutactus]